MSQKINSNWKTGGRIPATSPKKRGNRFTVQEYITICQQTSVDKR